MIEDKRIPERNNWQIELPLAAISALSADPLGMKAPVAVDQFEIDWSGKTLKVSGFIYGETRQ